MNTFVYGCLVAALSILVLKLIGSQRGRLKIGSLVIGWRY